MTRAFLMLLKLVLNQETGLSTTFLRRLFSSEWLTKCITPILTTWQIWVVLGKCSPASKWLNWLSANRTLNGATPIKFVNTSMHGVSDAFAKQGFSVFGFAPYVPVKEQQLPDAEFPTVQFPNPEEKGRWLCLYPIHMCFSLKWTRGIGVFRSKSCSRRLF